MRAGGKIRPRAPPAAAAAAAHTPASVHMASPAVFGSPCSLKSGSAGRATPAAAQQQRASGAAAHGAAGGASPGDELRTPMSLMSLGRSPMSVSRTPVAPPPSPAVQVHTPATAGRPQQLQRAH